MNSTLTVYDPRAEMVPTRSLIDHLLEGSVFAPSSANRWSNHTTSVPANLIETDDAYLVHISIPGLDSSKLDIQVAQRSLRIRGVYEAPKVEKGSVIWQGLPSGEFSQTFTLPTEVTGDGADASYTNGIVMITVPKAQHTKVKSIRVKMTV